MSKTKILMVCLGNICRSPLAEGILRDKLNSEDFFVDSAGTSNYHVGDSPDSRAVKIAQTNNIDISHLKGKQIKASDFEEFDYIYVMDQSNYHNVIALASKEAHKNKVQLILDVLEEISNNEVPDPYYGDFSDFEKVYTLLEKACKKIASCLQK